MYHDWILAAAGGALIGVAAVIMLFGIGRITGISGIARQLFLYKPNAFNSENTWRWLFVAGLIIGAFMAHKLFGIAIPQNQAGSTISIVIAGLLVGYGTTIGSGCTSGHGICGISRLSLRSIAATLVFMAAGMVMVFIVRHLI